MRKWILLLALALLLNVTRSYAEEIFYTNHQDRYYHSDAACGTPESVNWSGETREFYSRESYNKVEITPGAASAFEKVPCPLCVEKYEPVYLGEHFPEWPLECDPWGIGDIDPEARMNLMKKRPQAYTDEIAATSQAADAYLEESYDHEAEDVRMRNAYPDWYAGRWANNATGSTYALVSPSQEVLDEFKSLFGCGAWIVPAKYGLGELRSAQDEIFAVVSEWCKTHPEAGAEAVSASASEVENAVFIGIYGTGWQNAAAAMDKTAPVYVHFYQETSLPTTDF